MATLKEVKRLKALCNEYGLEGRENLDTFTNTELASVFNGIGPESFPDWRGLLRPLRGSGYALGRPDRLRRQAHLAPYRNYRALRMRRR